MIFLDNASTTKVFDEVNSVIAEINSKLYFNASALYKNALVVKDILEDSRRTIAQAVNAEKNEIIFTSCATESNNWVLNNGLKNKKGSLVISAGEHASIYDCAQHLKAKGIEVKIAGLLPNGSLDLEDFEKKLDKNTSLVSVIHCSNETGAINNLEQIVKIVREKAPSALIHSDGVQAFCKINTDVKKLGVDFYTITAHKIGGPKGCGALYKNKNIKIAPLLHGGGQEFGLRSGTENVAGIAGFAKAVEIFKKKNSHSEVRKAFEYLKTLLTDNGWIYNGSENNSGFILSCSYKGIKSEVLQHMLSDEDVLIGLGSACSSKSSENRVLSAIGRSKKEVEGSIRLSFCVDTTLVEAKEAGQKILQVLNKLNNVIK